MQTNELHEQWIRSNIISPISFDTMRFLVVVLFAVYALLSSAVLALAEDDAQYTTKFDNVDVDSIINNERLLNGYVGCLLDRNPCTPDAGELKSEWGVFAIISFYESNK